MSLVNSVCIFTRRIAFDFTIDSVGIRKESVDLHKCSDKNCAWQLDFFISFYFIVFFFCFFGVFAMSENVNDLGAAIVISKNSN